MCIWSQERWYNVDKPIKEGFAGELIPGLSDTDTWSVDNPALWNVLAPCIQIASTFFKVSAALPLYVTTGAGVAGFRADKSLIVTMPSRLLIKRRPNGMVKYRST